MFYSYNKYIIRLISWPTFLITLSLTGIVWLTQALRYIDFIVNRGLSMLDFLYLAILLIPSLLLLIMPVALFVGVIFAYNKLASDSELVVLKASGLSSWQLAKPALIVGIIVTIIVYAVSLYFMPVAKRQFKETQNFLRNNYASVLLQEEVFNSPVDGLTVFVRERDEYGNLKGILVYDNRIANKTSTLIAEEGKLVETASGPRFYLVNGQRQENSSGRISWLDFDSYNLDISFYTQRSSFRKIGAEEMFIHELLDPKNHTDKKMAAKYVAQAHQRVTWPIFALGLSILAAAILLRGEFNRRGQWQRITKLSFAALGMTLALFGFANIIVKTPSLTPILYVFSIGLVAFSVFLLLRDVRMSPLAINNKGEEKAAVVSPAV